LWWFVAVPGTIYVNYRRGWKKSIRATSRTGATVSSIRIMQIRYLEMEGAGNRILVVDERHRRQPPPDADTIRRLGDPATGPGFDQLMWVGPARSTAAVASYRVFNRDGGEVEQCGNGVRCVARMLADAGVAPTSFLLESPAGPVAARLAAGGQVAVDMGRPEFRPEHIPFISDREAKAYELDVNGELVEIGAVAMGNPHCVVALAEIASAAPGRLGPLIERHPRFPKRTNVGFMAIYGRDRIGLRVHERGVGETLACGTGACAAVAVGRRRGELDGDVRVDLPGGQLVVSWPREEDSVWLTGDAEMISEGTIDL
jgi:diaminopimelate epimerase